MVWHRGTGQASYNLTIKDGQADLQLSFQLGKPEDRHLPLPSQRTRTKVKGQKQKQRDCARAAAHHARLATATAVRATEDEVNAVETGTPALTVPPSPPASGVAGTGPIGSRKRPSTRSTTVLVKMKMAAFARSGAEISLKETLPVFIPGFDQKIDYYFNECDFADEEEKKYFNKYSNIFVFGFYLEKELVTTELLEKMKSQWIEKDKYWNHRPAEVFEISI